MDLIYELFLTHEDEITWWAMSTRAVVVFFFAILIVRAGSMRFFGKNSVFDIVLSLIWGSILSRAITGNAPFIASLVASTILVGLHWLLSFASSRFHHIGWIFKGSFVKIIENGELQKRKINSLHLSDNDLMEWLRSRGHVTDPKEVKEAYFERDGTISVIPKKEIKILDVKVSEGVQTIRIEIK